MTTTLPLYNFENGSFMIYFFMFVCLGLVAAIFLFMAGGSKKKDDEDDEGGSFKDV